MRDDVTGAHVEQALEKADDEEHQEHDPENAVFLYYSALFLQFQNLCMLYTMTNLITIAPPI